MDGWLVFARLKDWQSQSLGDLSTHQGRYPVIFKLIPLFEIYQEKGRKKGVVGGH